MQDEQIYALISKVGELTGKVDAFIVNQDRINETLTTMVTDNHGPRITSLEGSKKTLIGVAVGAGFGSGVVSSGFLTTAIKFLKGFSA